MCDLEKLLEILRDVPSSTNVQDLMVHLSDLIEDQDNPEGIQNPSERHKDQE
ncbi:MAG: hypothetical protein K9N55_20295 [Phycisphaerae bacterium]|nr:hypothetical protein [Phycisphaerae bacterium]